MQRGGGIWLQSQPFHRFSGYVKRAREESLMGSQLKQPNTSRADLSGQILMASAPAAVADASSTPKLTLNVSEGSEGFQEPENFNFSSPAVEYLHLDVVVLA